MQIHELKTKNKNLKKKRVGRGGKKGTYSSRGMKGQNSRAGRKFVPVIRELIKRYPKLKGYRRFVLPKDVVIVSLDMLEKVCKDGDIVSRQFLLEKGLIKKYKGKTPKVKILKGGLTKKISIENCKVSKIAKEIIEKVGGIVKN